jgi:hypothetical protein
MYVRGFIYFKISLRGIPRSHPFLPPAGTSLIDTIVKNSLPEDTPYYTSRESDDELKTRRAHIIACLIEHDKKKGFCSDEVSPV